MKSYRRQRLIAFLLTWPLLLGPAVESLAAIPLPVHAPASNPRPVNGATQLWLEKAYGQLPLAFEPNQGQTDSQVKFLARGSGYSLYLTPAEAVFALKRGSARPPGNLNPAVKPFPAPSEVLRLRLVGGNRKAVFEGLGEMGGKSNYFSGNNPANWRVGISQYAKVKMDEVYPGIDMLYYGNQGRLEYDFVVKPGADLGVIRLDYQGARKVMVDGQGNLVFHMAQGDVAFETPMAYQTVAGEKKRLEGRYVIAGNQQIGFKVGDYDKNLPLVIDPVLDYSTYLGGSFQEECYAIAVDSVGNAYVTGETTSGFTLPFPTTAGSFQPTFATGASDNAFVTKLNAAGTALVYSAFLGGNNINVGEGIAVDSSGEAYVTGYTSATNFPTTSGAFQTVFGGGDDVFMSKVNAAGSSLIYSTYLGGSGSDAAQAIALDSSGNAYVTGTAAAGFPTTSGAYQTTSTSADTFMAKINPAGGGASDLLYSTYLYGSSYSGPFAVAVDSSGDAYVAGCVEGGFPTTSGAYQTTYGGGVYDGFVAKLNPAGGGASDLLYSTFLGGSGNDCIYSIAVDSSKKIYITGTTSGNFPTTSGAYQTVYGGGDYDAFVAKLNPAGGGASDLLYSTLLGGSGDDYPRDLAVNSSGDAFVTGYTDGGFPTTNGAYQTNYAGGADNGFLAELNPNGTSLLYSTYFGGSAGDISWGIAMDPSGNVYLAGESYGAFPTTSGAFQVNFQGGGVDGFITKFDSSDFYTPTPGATNTPTPTPTNTFTNSPTSTPTNSPTATGTNSPTNSPTLTVTNTSTKTMTNSPSSTPTLTFTLTDTPPIALTSTATPTASDTATPTSTPVNTNSPTVTSTPTLTLGSTTVAIGLPYPNPAPGPVTVQIQAPAGSTLEWSVFTTAFRKVLDSSSPISGHGFNLVWNLEDQWQKPVANGLYYLRVRVTGPVNATKILKVLVAR